jgi:hypothetical protein
MAFMLVVAREFDYLGTIVNIPAPKQAYQNAHFLALYKILLSLSAYLNSLVSVLLSDTPRKTLDDPNALRNTAAM